MPVQGMFRGWSCLFNFLSFLPSIRFSDITEEYLGFAVLCLSLTLTLGNLGKKKKKIKQTDNGLQKIL